MSSGTWVDVLEQQFAIYRFWKSPIGRRWADAWLSERTADGLPAMSRVLDRMEEEKLLLGAPISVAPEIVDLIEAASPEFDLSETLQPTDLFCSHGFALLPRCLIAKDRRDKNVTWRAFSWSCYKKGTPTDDPNLSEASFCEAEDADGIVISIYSHIDDAELDDYGEWADYAAIANMKWSLFHCLPWAFGDPLLTYSEYLGTDTNGEQLIDPGSMNSIYRQIQVFFRLAQQTITREESLRPPRPQRRTIERDPERSAMRTDVVLVTLRHQTPKKHDDDEREPVEWSHRWIVQGHWRNQWYPSIGEHRQIWIAPFVKGPEDAELIIKPMRAFDFRR